jgi:sec-independent protein translocase protein TatB
MFDVGFSEFIVIGLVALIVIGPERLPGVARTVGHLLGRLQRYVSDVKSDINREMQLDELKKLQEQVTTEARAMESQVNDQMRSVETSLNASIAQGIEEKSPAAADAGQPAIPMLSADQPDAVPPAPTLSAAPVVADKPAA